VKLICALPVLLLSGCASTSYYKDVTVDANGISLTLTSSDASRAALRMKNTSSAPIAYDHWMAQGPDATPYSCDSTGVIRICSSRVFLTPEGRPMTHETYLQPGSQISFEARPSPGEQVGVRLWIAGRDQYVWLTSVLPNPSLERP
jgi:hypothetical protein